MPTRQRRTKQKAEQQKVAQAGHVRREVALDDAFKRGDMNKLRELYGDPPDFPNHRPSGPLSIADRPLEYAIYHSPLAFIRELLDLSIEINYADHAGFPPLIAAMGSDRDDCYEILQVLLDRGADVQVRGNNGYTPLHFAAVRDDLKAIEILLAHGADPKAKTDVDDFTTPLEEAESVGHTRAADRLRKHVSR